MNIFQSIVLAIVEGLTEYLPVSSTGHMIIASSFMGIASDPFVKFFTVSIQLGAILAVVVLYFKRFFKSFDFYFKLLAAFIPSAIFGVLFNDKIDQLLESPLSVAIALLVGGVFLLFVDKIFDQSTTITLHNSDKISYFTAFKIGLFQCIAMVPGVSRSAATTIGGMAQRLSRKAAAEFSFFLAVPTMFAATAKKALDYYQDGFKLSSDQIQLLAIGNIVAFVVALAAIKFFIDFLSRYGFKLFGIYRIIVGGILLAMILSGVKLQIL